MRTKNLRRWIKEYLKHGPKDTWEIYEFINSKHSHGVTMSQLGNILSKDYEINKTGSRRRKNYGHNLAIWELNEKKKILRPGKGEIISLSEISNEYLLTMFKKIEKEIDRLERELERKSNQLKELYAEMKDRKLVYK